MRILIVVIVSLIASNAYSQDTKLGLYAGLSMANFYDHNASSSKALQDINFIGFSQPYYQTGLIDDMRVGVALSLVAEFPIYKRLSFEGGIGYTQKGIKLNSVHRSALPETNTSTSYSYQVSRDLKFNYFNISMVSKYYMDIKKRFYVAAGIYSAIGLRFKINDATVTKTFYDSNGMWTTRNSISIDETEVKAVDAGLIAGIGNLFPLNNQWSIGADMRMNLGLIPLHAGGNDIFLNFSESSKNINLVTAITVFYTW